MLLGQSFNPWWLTVPTGQSLTPLTPNGQPEKSTREQSKSSPTSTDMSEIAQADRPAPIEPRLTRD